MHDLVMATIPKPRPRVPSKEFGQAAVKLAIERWGSHAAALKRMGYKPDSETLRRLQRGEGSDKSAYTLYKTLKEDGADTSKLPPIYPDEESTDEPTWRQVSPLV